MLLQIRRRQHIIRSCENWRYFMRSTRYNNEAMINLYVHTNKCCHLNTRIAIFIRFLNTHRERERQSSPSDINPSQKVLCDLRGLNWRAPFESLYITARIFEECHWVNIIIIHRMLYRSSSAYTILCVVHINRTQRITAETNAALKTKYAQNLPLRNR
jgi:hypothetical protein